ncbi:MAG TPA: DHA2 family efflux MFS transporter permease subunit [Thermoleophilaceae bacterium]|nr:DHA2 family efflux MFS transporter permease subunit [Thermoleophilaceae bacterium]
MIQPTGKGEDMHRKWWTLLVVCVATFMLLLDITIVNVALPSIQKALHASFQDLQWVVDAYALTLAALLLTAGSLADLLGRKRVFLTGIAVFTVASLLCGLATEPLMLNLSRGLQGIGGAIMFACSLALLAQEFRGRERGTAYGIWGATIAAAAAVGPLVGGGLTEGLGWEYIFFINLPVGVIAIVLGAARLAESRDEDARGVDWAGLVTFSASLFLLVLALIRGNSVGWGSTQILAELVGAAVLFALFLLAEARQERPMFDLTLFGKPTFAGASLVAFALSASLFAMFLYITLYLQNILGYSPLQTGVRFLPVTGIGLVVAPIAGRLGARMSPRWFLGGGVALVGIGLFLMHGVTATSSWTELLPGLVIAGAGVGIANPTIAQVAIGVVPPARAGMASGINNTCRQVGIATGIAGLGAVFQHQVQAKAAQLHSRAPEAAHQAFASGLNTILIVGGVVAVVGAACGFLLVRRSDLAEDTAHAEATAAAG